MNEKLQIPQIAPEEVDRQLQSGKQVNIIDVREVDEYVSGHIPEAKLIPLSEFAERYQEIDPQQEAIVVCRSGQRSSMATEFLLQQGYKKILNMTGGMLAWQGDLEK